MNRTPSRAGRAEVASWALYDFASSAFNTLVLTFIFSRYFAEVVAADPADPNAGAVLWTRAVNISALVVALALPVMGAMADFSGRKKQFLVFFALVSIVFSALLFFVGPGMAVQGALIFILANIGFEAANAFYYAFLPEIATKKTMGRISGLGFALGYAGGFIAILLGLGFVRGWLPDDGYLDVRATNLLVAGWFLVFALPMFLLVRERVPRRSAPATTYVREGFHRVRVTFGHIRTFREAAKALLARMIYNDGVATIFAMASIYAGAALGMELEQFLVLALFLNVAAGAGAFAFGFVNDRIGSKRTVVISLVVLIGASLFGAVTTTVAGFWVAGMLIGLMVGPNQSASRALLASLTPESKHGEFFGFFYFTGKLSSVLGPLAYGTVLGFTGSHRLAISSVILFFVVGLVVLLFVREREGIEIARSWSEEAEGLVEGPAAGPAGG